MSPLMKTYVILKLSQRSDAIASKLLAAGYTSEPDANGYVFKPLVGSLDCAAFARFATSIGAECHVARETQARQIHGLPV